MSLQYFFMLHPENIKYRIYFILKTKFKIIYFYYLLNEKNYINFYFTSLIYIQYKLALILLFY